ncbi:MAG: hypothetical protein K2X27_27760 [Candidatus Obscuribacterales bacterium]|nr:hypothetical protein [Candidatus Obscuribacterales bacterium]
MRTAAEANLREANRKEKHQLKFLSSRARREKIERKALFMRLTEDDNELI